MTKILIKNGRIYTLDDANPIANVVVIEDGTFTYVGKDMPAGSYDLVIDLEGKCVLPGFVDAHMHLSSYAVYRHTVNLSDTNSISELKRKLADRPISSSTWIFGRGWDHEEFKEDRLPTRLDLDDVTREKPILIVRKCGHIGVVNTPGIRIMHDILDVGRYIDNIDLENGWLYEAALQRMIEVIYKEMLSPSVLKAAIDHIISKGITAIHWMSADSESLRTLYDTYDGPPPIRIYAYLSSDLSESIHEIRKEEESSRLRIMGIKLFIDGSFGARTAALREEYNDDPGNSGKVNISHSELKDTLNRCLAENIQVAVHVIGDKALEILIAALEEVDPSIVRYIRIEHLSLLPDDLLDRLIRLGPVKVCIQPKFVSSDYWIEDRLGNRAEKTYRFRSMIDSGFTLGIGSDAPVEVIDPFVQLHDALYGPYRDNSEALDLATSVEIYTYGGARLVDEDRLGKIKVGYKADIVAIDRDIFRCTKDALIKANVLLTIVDGRILFDRLNVRQQSR